MLETGFIIMISPFSPGEEWGHGNGVQGTKNVTGITDDKLTLNENKKMAQIYTV